MGHRGLWTAVALLAAFNVGVSVGQAQGAWVTASAYSPADSGSVTACGPRLDWTTPTVATVVGALLMLTLLAFAMTVGGRL